MLGRTSFLFASWKTFIYSSATYFTIVELWIVAWCWKSMSTGNPPPALQSVEYEEPRVTVSTVTPPSAPPVVRHLRLRAERPRKKVRWAENVVDNEHLNRKSSKGEGFIWASSLHTHTHTHTQREREREKNKHFLLFLLYYFIEGVLLFINLLFHGNSSDCSQTICSLLHLPQTSTLGRVK